MLTSAITGLAVKIERWRMSENALYSTAVSFIGRDASPADIAPDAYGCMETVSRILQKAYPELRFPTMLSTREGLAYFQKSPSFMELSEPVYGCIIISATGTGNGSVSNGHVGIVGKNTSPDGSVWVMSNSSMTGTWEVNFTLNSWKRYFQNRGGMSVHYFLVS